MKISKDAPVEKVEYEIESKYGVLECTFYPENADGYFFGVFSSFAEDREDFESTNPSFEKHKERAMEIFAEQFPKRLEELLEETVKDVEINTLIEIRGISLKEAKQIRSEALRASNLKKKERMNAPSAGRPAGESKWNKESLRNGIIKAVQEMPKSRNPTYEYVAEKLDPPTTEEYLRKLIKQHKLNWKELKKRT